MSDVEKVIVSPKAGDIVEIQEEMKDLDGDPFVGDMLLRVLAVVEDWVWFKEYGRPERPSLPLCLWQKRLRKARSCKLILPSK